MQTQLELNGRVGRLFGLRRKQLVAFFRRYETARNVSEDLAQETFIRVLRADETQAIRNPEAYLFTVAGNLAREHAVLNRRFGAAKDVSDPGIENELADWPAIDDQLDASRRHRILLEVLEELSPKCRAAVVLQYRDELSYQEIAERLDVSSHMVKKYLAKALLHCRKRLASRKDAL